MSEYQRPVVPTGLSTFDAHTRRRPPSKEAGVDYYCPMGTPILAAADGFVVEIGGSTEPATGRYLTIDLDDGLRVRYLHLSRWAKNRGDRVQRGDVVAYSGASGYGSEFFGASSLETIPWNTGGPHVHTTLWPTHRYRFGADAGTLDIERYVGGVDARLSPEEPETSQEDDMIFVEDTQGNRGRAIVVGGKWIPLANADELSEASKRASEKWYIETAEFDLWKNLFGRGDRTLVSAITDAADDGASAADIAQALKSKLAAAVVAELVRHLEP